MLQCQRFQPRIYKNPELGPVADWMTQMYARSLSAVTIRERLRVLNAIEDATGTPPDRVSAAQIAQWLASGPWSATTRVTYHGYLRAWFEFLQVQEHRIDNPMVKIPTPRSPRRRPRPVDDAHLEHLLSIPLRRKTRAMILLAALQGFRVHEIAKTRGEDIDHLADTIHVIGKGGTEDYLPLHPLVAELAKGMPARGFWFPSNSRAALPGCIHSRSVTDVISAAMRRAGVPGTPHSLRHWFGTTLVDSGVDLRTTQELLRHASLQTTQIYTRVSNSRRRAGIRSLDPSRAGIAARKGAGSP